MKGIKSYTEPCEKADACEYILLCSTPKSCRLKDVSKVQKKPSRKSIVIPVKPEAQNYVRQQRENSYLMQSKTVTPNIAGSISQGIKSYTEPCEVLDACEYMLLCLTPKSCRRRGEQSPKKP